MYKSTALLNQPWRREAPTLTSGIRQARPHMPVIRPSSGGASEQLFSQILGRQTGGASPTAGGMSLTEMLQSQTHGQSGQTSNASAEHASGLGDPRFLAGLRPGSASHGISHGHGYGNHSTRGPRGHMAKALRTATAATGTRRSAQLSSSREQSTPEERHEQLTKQAEKWVGQTFYGQMLKQMHESPFKSKLFDGGRGGEAFSSLYDQHLIDRMSRGAGGKLVNSLVTRIEGRGARANISGGARQPTPLGLPPAAKRP